MEDKVPLLNLEQIQELTNMVSSIQLDNTKKLETILSQTVEISETTILTLYNLAVDEWKKKQTVIDNLCHFTLTMMSTVEMLWLQQHDQSDKLNSAQGYIQHLKNNIYELGDQNLSIKQKIKEVEIKISTITQEKERIQELYKSQSCIAFNDQFENQIQQTLQKHCSACSQMHIKSQEESISKLHKSQKFIQQKLQELSEVLQQKKFIEEEYNQLKEQHDLTRMQLELAEMAIKDALVYKHSYLSILSNSNELQTSRNQSILENSKVYEDQGIIEDIKHLGSRILESQIHIPETLQMQSIFRGAGFQQNSQISNDGDLSLIKMVKQQKRTTHQSPLKKKEDNNQKSFVQLGQESRLGPKHNIKQINSNFQISTEFDLRKGYQTKKEINFIISKQGEKLRSVKSLKLLGNTKQMKKQKHKEQDQSQSSLVKLYTLISNKLVTNRIKKR